MSTVTRTTTNARKRHRAPGPALRWSPATVYVFALLFCAAVWLALIVASVLLGWAWWALPAIGLSVAAMITAGILLEPVVLAWVSRRRLEAALADALTDPR